MPCTAQPGSEHRAFGADSLPRKYEGQSSVALYARVSTNGRVQNPETQLCPGSTPPGRPTPSSSASSSAGPAATTCETGGSGGLARRHFAPKVGLVRGPRE